jgi:hypothetical protein
MIEKTLYEVLEKDELDAIYDMFNVLRAKPFRLRSISVSNEMPTQRNEKYMNVFLNKELLGPSKEKPKRSVSLESIDMLGDKYKKRTSKSLADDQKDQMLSLKKLAVMDEAAVNGFVSARAIKAPIIQLFNGLDKIEQKHMEALKPKLTEAERLRSQFNSVKSQLSEYVNDRWRPHVSQHTRRIHKTKSAIGKHFYTSSSYLNYNSRIDVNSYLKMNKQLETNIRDERGILKKLVMLIGFN